MEGLNIEEQLDEKTRLVISKMEADYYQKRYEIRLEKSAPIIEDFIKYVDLELQNALPRSLRI